ncbi:MAG: sulfite exporter TauE/SafE family protein [Nocardioidaceae bacterium]
MLGVAALLVGLAKTSVGGLATIAVALAAGVMPARESTAALLLLLLVGDVVAVSIYRRDGDWRLLARLVPAVLPGLVVGSLVLAVVDDQLLRRGIGALLICLVALQLGLSLRPVPGGAPGSAPSRSRASAAGLAAGFTTMVANAGGPVMTLYLVAQRVDKRRFLGTASWFFLGVNLCKLPFSVGLGLVDRTMVVSTVALAPVVVLGGIAGALVVRRMGQRTFDVAVLAASGLSGLALLVR